MEQKSQVKRFLAKTTATLLASLFVAELLVPLIDFTIKPPTPLTPKAEAASVQEAAGGDPVTTTDVVDNGRTGNVIKMADIQKLGNASDMSAAQSVIRFAQVFGEKQRIWLPQKDLNFIKTCINPATRSQCNIDRRVLYLLNYLVTPTEFGGAGHYWISGRINSRYDKDRKSLDRETDEGRDESLLSSHNVGLALDIYEIDGLTCRLRIVKGKKTTIEYQPTRNLKVIAQTDKGASDEAAAASADADDFARTFEGESGVRLATEISDNSDFAVPASALTGDTMGDMAKDAAFSVLSSEDLGLPGKAFSGGIGELINTSGRDALSQVTGLPIDGFFGDTIDDLYANTGRAKIEQGLGLTAGSFIGDTTDEIETNAGARSLENKLGLANGLFTQLGGDYAGKKEDIPSLFGVGKAAKDFGLSPDLLTGSNKDEIAAKLGNRFDIFAKNPVEADNYFGLGGGKTEAFVSGSLSPKDYFADIGNKLIGDKIGNFKDFRTGWQEIASTGRFGGGINKPAYPSGLQEVDRRDTNSGYEVIYENNNGESIKEEYENSDFGSGLTKIFRGVTDNKRDEAYDLVPKNDKTAPGMGIIDRVLDGDFGALKQAGSWELTKSFSKNTEERDGIYDFLTKGQETYPVKTEAGGTEQVAVSYARLDDQMKLPKGAFKAIFKDNKTDSIKDLGKLIIGSISEDQAKIDGKSIEELNADQEALSTEATDPNTSATRKTEINTQLEAIQNKIDWGTQVFGSETALSKNLYAPKSAAWLVGQLQSGSLTISQAVSNLGVQRVAENTGWSETAIRGISSSDPQDTKKIIGRDEFAGLFHGDPAFQASSSPQELLGRLGPKKFIDTFSLTIPTGLKASDLPSSIGTLSGPFWDYKNSAQLQKTDLALGLEKGSTLALFNGSTPYDKFLENTGDAEINSDYVSEINDSLDLNSLSYNVNTNDVVDLLSGNWKSMARKVGGKIIDDGLELPAGSTAMMMTGLGQTNDAFSGAGALKIGQFANLRGVSLMANISSQVGQGFTDKLKSLSSENLPAGVSSIFKKLDISPDQLKAAAGDIDNPKNNDFLARALGGSGLSSLFGKTINTNIGFGDNLGRAAIENLGLEAGAVTPGQGSDGLLAKVGGRAFASAFNLYTPTGLDDTAKADYIKNNAMNESSGYWDRSDNQRKAASIETSLGISLGSLKEVMTGKKSLDSLTALASGALFKSATKDRMDKFFFENEGGPTADTTGLFNAVTGGNFGAVFSSVGSIFGKSKDNSMGFTGNGENMGGSEITGSKSSFFGFKRERVDKIAGDGAGTLFSVISNPSSAKSVLMQEGVKILGDRIGGTEKAGKISGDDAKLGGGFSFRDNFNYYTGGNKPAACRVESTATNYAVAGISSLFDSTYTEFLPADDQSSCRGTNMMGEVSNFITDNTKLLDPKNLANEIFKVDFAKGSKEGDTNFGAIKDLVNGDMRSLTGVALAFSAADQNKDDNASMKDPDGRSIGLPGGFQINMSELSRSVFGDLSKDLKESSGDISKKLEGVTDGFQQALTKSDFINSNQVNFQNLLNYKINDVSIFKNFDSHIPAGFSLGLLSGEPGDRANLLGGYFKNLVGDGMNLGGSLEALGPISDVLGIPLLGGKPGDILHLPDASLLGKFDVLGSTNILGGFNDFISNSGSKLFGTILPTEFNAGGGVLSLLGGNLAGSLGGNLGDLGGLGSIAGAAGFSLGNLPGLGGFASALPSFANIGSGLGITSVLSGAGGLGGLTGSFGLGFLTNSGADLSGLAGNLGGLGGLGNLGGLGGLGGFDAASFTANLTGMVGGFVDKALGLPAGSAMKMYDGFKALQAAKATGNMAAASAAKANLIALGVTLVFGKTFAKIDDALGLPSGFTSALVTALIVGGPIAWAAVAITMIFGGFGKTKVYYECPGVTARVGGARVVEKDLIGGPSWRGPWVDGKNPTLWKNWAKNRVATVIDDMVRAGDRSKQDWMMPNQIITYSKGEFDYFCGMDSGTYKKEEDLITQYYSGKPKDNIGDTQCCLGQCGNRGLGYSKYVSDHVHVSY